jgi:hypothetical protein
MTFRPSALAANALKICVERGCTTHRQKNTLSTRCRFHNNARRNHQIRPSLLHPFRKVAARFIKDHQNDEPMILALATLRELLEPGEEPQSRVSRVWRRPEEIGRRGNWNADYLVWKRLMLLKHPLMEPAHGGCRPGQPRPYRRRPPIEPEEVLREMLTVFLLTESYPDFLKDDGKPLSVEVARRIFKLRPSGKSNTNSKTPSFSACVTFGERLRNSPVWVFMFANAETIKLEENARREKKATMYRPIIPKLPRDLSTIPLEQLTDAEKQIVLRVVEQYPDEHWKAALARLWKEQNPSW